VPSIFNVVRAFARKAPPGPLSSRIVLSLLLQHNFFLIYPFFSRLETELYMSFGFKFIAKFILLNTNLIEE
jgi:hypothetical protein